MTRKIHYTPQLVVSSLFLVVLMIGVVIYVEQKKIANQSQTGKSELIMTKRPNQTIIIGGQPQDATTSSSSSSQPPADATPQPTPQVQKHQSPSRTNEAQSQAPKQDQIEATITKEYTYTALAVPNDTYYNSAWQMQQTNAPSAWNLSTGTANTIAVIDTGFALQHEDLNTVWATNSGEIGTTQLGERCWTGTPQDKSSNGCDDDDNGYIDDYRGWNFVSKNNSPQAGNTSTNGVGAISHGTAVAGLAGAATNNAMGIASYNWKAKIMPLQALDDAGSGSTSGIVSAIIYAVDNGASVINLSLGSPENDPALQPAINYAYDRNVTIVAAAGNCGTTGDAGCYGMPAPVLMYPAIYNHVIAVGATDVNNQRAGFSSYGTGLDVVAPGSGSIIAPYINISSMPYNYTNTYSGSLYGTSFASPIVSSIVSLIKSIKPDATVDEITALVDGSATKLPAMNGKNFTDQHGHGLINIGSAAVIVDHLTKNPTSPPTLLQTGDSRSEHSISVTSTISSGCSATAQTYCTVRMQNNATKFDRYLPYQKTDNTGRTSWQWTADTIGGGEWSLRAIQSSQASTTPYLLFAK